MYVMRGSSDPEDVDILSDGRLSDMVVSSSTDDDNMSIGEGFEWSTGMSSLAWFNLIPKNGDYSNYKNQIQRELRVGSSYHVGTREVPLRPGIIPNEIACPDNENPSNKLKCTLNFTSSDAFLRHPLYLISAREQGSLGPSSKCKRLIYKSTRWRVAGHPRFDGLQCFGNRAKGAFHTDPQTFQESICGSLWAVSRLHLADKFKCHRGCVNSVCFNSTGNWIASGSDDLKVVVTDWNMKQQVFKYNTGHCMNIFHVKFLPETNDTKLVSCACDSEVRLAELFPDGTLAGGSTRLLVSHNRSCHKLALPAGEPYTVLSAGADGQVFSIDVRIAKADNILWLPFSEFYSIASNPVRPYEIALCGRSESIVRIYDRRKMTGRDPKSGYLHCFGADHLRSNGRRSPSVDPLQTDPVDESGDERTSADDRAHSEDEDDSGSFLSSLSVQLGRRVRDVLNGLRDRAEVAFRFHDNTRPSATSHPSYKLESSRYNVTAAVYTNQGDAILASYNDEDIYLFDTRYPSKPYLHKYSGHRNMQTIVSAGFFGPNSEYIVSGSDDGFFYMWDRESEGIVQWLHADADGAVNVVEAHPSLPILATAGLDYDFKIWAPLRSILDSEDESYAPHLKYTFGKVPPTVRRLRHSRLAKALFSDPDVPLPLEVVSTSATNNSDMASRVDSASVLSVSQNALHVTTPPVTAPSHSNSKPLRKRRRHRSSSSSSSASFDCYSADHSSVQSDNANPSDARPTHIGRSSKRYRKRSNDDNSKTAVLNSTNSAVVNEPVNASGCGLGLPDSGVKLEPPPHMPFNVQDLQLRAAQNWINRTCERVELEGLVEADSRIMSAIETVAQLHGRVRPRRNDETRDGSTDTDVTSDEDSIMGSFILLRRPNCPVERSEETLTACDRLDESLDVTSSSITNRSSSSSSSTFSSSSSSSSQSTPIDSEHSRRSSPSSSFSDPEDTTVESSSTSSTSSSSTPSSPARGRELLKLLASETSDCPSSPPLEQGDSNSVE